MLAVVASSSSSPWSLSSSSSSSLSFVVVVVVIKFVVVGGVWLAAGAVVEAKCCKWKAWRSVRRSYVLVAHHNSHASQASHSRPKTCFFMLYYHSYYCWLFAGWYYLPLPYLLDAHNVSLTSTISTTTTTNHLPDCGLLPAIRLPDYATPTCKPCVLLPPPACYPPATYDLPPTTCDYHLPHATATSTMAGKRLALLLLPTYLPSRLHSTYPLRPTSSCHS